MSTELGAALPVEGQGVSTAPAAGPSGQPSAPTGHELAQLPRWAVIAFAALCARRAQPLFAAHWPDAPANHQQAIETALRATCRAAASATPIAPDVAADAACAAFAAQDAGSPIAERAARAISFAAFAGASADRPLVPAAPAMHTAEAAEIVASLHGGRAPIVAGLRRDYARLAELAAARHWTDDTPVPLEAVEEAPAKPSLPDSAQLLAHWERQLAGQEVLPLLQTPSEVHDLLARELHGREVSPNERRRLTEVFSLQFYYAGRQIACLRSPKGLVVLAVGSQQVGLLFGQFSLEQLQNVTIEFPG